MAATVFSVSSVSSPLCSPVLNPAFTRVFEWFYFRRNVRRVSDRCRGQVLCFACVINGEILAHVCVCVERPKSGEKSAFRHAQTVQTYTSVGPLHMWGHGMANTDQWVKTTDDDGICMSLQDQRAFKSQFSEVARPDHTHTHTHTHAQFPTVKSSEAHDPNRTSSPF